MNFLTWLREVNVISEKETQLHIRSDNSLAKRLYEADIGVREAVDFLNENFARNFERYILNLIDKLNMDAYLWG